MKFCAPWSKGWGPPQTPDYWGCILPDKQADKGMAKTAKKTKRTPNAAFMKPVTPDEKLALIVGDKPLPRTELTKKLWAYIRKNGLQDKKVRTQINADEALTTVFKGKKQVSMFEMTKLVSGHLKK
jgi:chromatin remodeling complex protein RSC6